MYYLTWLLCHCQLNSSIRTILAPPRALRRVALSVDNEKVFHTFLELLFLRVGLRLIINHSDALTKLWFAVVSHLACNYFIFLLCVCWTAITSRLHAQILARYVCSMFLIQPPLKLKSANIQKESYDFFKFFLNFGSNAQPQERSNFL